MEGRPNIAAEIELSWADGTYLFALKLKQIEELQRLCGAGLGEIAQRLLVNGHWYVRDITETIRLALVGGGMAPTRALEMIATYVDGHPISSMRSPDNPLTVAQAVMTATYYGIEEESGDGSGKAEAAAVDGTASSTSRRSTARRSRSASRRSTSAE